MAWRSKQMRQREEWVSEFVDERAGGDTISFCDVIGPRPGRVSGLGTCVGFLARLYGGRGELRRGEILDVVFEGGHLLCGCFRLLPTLSLSFLFFNKFFFQCTGCY